jgi:hypothetical protein
MRYLVTSSMRYVHPSPEFISLLVRRMGDADIVWITSTIQYSSVMECLTFGLYDLDRERSPTVRLRMDTEHKPRLAVPLLPRPYDGTPMGTLPAQRGRGNAGFGLQDGGSCGDRTQGNDARPDRGLSIPAYRFRTAELVTRDASPSFSNLSLVIHSRKSL